MDRNRVVNTCLNSKTVEVLLQFFAPACAHDVEMKDVLAARIERRHDEVFSQTIRIDRGVSTTRGIPRIKMLQLHIQYCRLHCIEPRVRALFDVHIFLLLSVVSEAVNLLRKVVVVSRDRTAITISTEIFPGVKTETTCETERAAALAQKARAMCLRCILDHFQLVLAGDFDNRRDVG